VGNTAKIKGFCSSLATPWAMQAVRCVFKI